MDDSTHSSNSMHLRSLRGGFGPTFPLGPWAFGRLKSIPDGYIYRERAGKLLGYMIGSADLYQIAPGSQGCEQALRAAFLHTVKQHDSRGRWHRVACPARSCAFEHPLERERERVEHCRLRKRVATQGGEAGERRRWWCMHWIVEWQHALLRVREERTALSVSPIISPSLSPAASRAACCVACANHAAHCSMLSSVCAPSR